MFNLEQSIAEWRRQMITAGIKTPVPLEELESHLWEDMERRVRAGADKARAFQLAAQQIGRPESLQAEFEKNQNTERKYMKRGLIIGGIIGVLVGMALVMPALAQYRHEGVMKNGEPWLFLIGSLLTLAGCVAAIRSLKKRTA